MPKNKKEETPKTVERPFFNTMFKDAVIQYMDTRDWKRTLAFMRFMYSDGHMASFEELPKIEKTVATFVDKILTIMDKEIEGVADDYRSKSTE